MRTKGFPIFAFLLLVLPALRGADWPGDWIELEKVVRAEPQRSAAFQYLREMAASEGRLAALTERWRSGADADAVSAVLAGWAELDDRHLQEAAKFFEKATKLAPENWH